MLSDTDRAAIRASYAAGDSIEWLAAQWKTTTWEVLGALNEGRECGWDST